MHSDGVVRLVVPLYIVRVVFSASGSGIIVGKPTVCSSVCSASIAKGFFVCSIVCTYLASILSYHQFSHIINSSISSILERALNGVCNIVLCASIGITLF